MIFLTHLKQMIMRYTQNSHIIKLRQWYLYHDEEAFRQLIQQADFSLTDNFLPEQYTKGCEYSWIKVWWTVLFMEMNFTMPLRWTTR